MTPHLPYKFSIFSYYIYLLLGGYMDYSMHVKARAKLKAVSPSPTNGSKILNSCYHA